MSATLQGIKQRYGIIGNSSTLNHALNVAVQVAPTDLSVLISGESGVGKEVFSKIIHQQSPRKHEGFIAVNCGAIPEGTIDSELFGHVKGSFTGATDHRKGYFETVNGGTIFLDEIGEMPIGTQARLLRVLESGEFIKVGASKVQKTNVRVIAATNVDLLQHVKQSKFREDLYYRLNTVPIYVPPLRERTQDIYLLFRKFATDFAEKYRAKLIILDEDAQLILRSYRWPGNVRELKNLAEQLSVLSTNEVVTAEELKSFLPNGENNFSLTPVNNTDSSFSEREILYKMLFEMKHDLNNIKDYLWNNGHHEAFKESAVTLPSESIPTFSPPAQQRLPQGEEGQHPILLDKPAEIYEAETVEENLSLAEMEKILIKKALTKHQGRRNKAALELGISERTLYRKIKEYAI